MVKYLLVGGYAVIFHGYSLTTGDMDIWVDCKTFCIFNNTVCKLLHCCVTFR
jgi:hypothetical protein